MKDSIVRWSIISLFTILYVLVGFISTLHLIDFFQLSNSNWMAIILSIAFEVGSFACLAAIIILDKTSRYLVWTLFIVVTSMQVSGNMYYAYKHLHDFAAWIELFGLQGEDIITQKRILAIVSGGILPLVALGFIKSLVDYIRPSEKIEAIVEPVMAAEPDGVDDVNGVDGVDGVDDVDDVDDVDNSEIEFELDDSVEEKEAGDADKMGERIESIQSDATLSEPAKLEKIERNIKRVIRENPHLREELERKLKELKPKPSAVDDSLSSIRRTAGL